MVKDLSHTLPLLLGTLFLSRSALLIVSLLSDPELNPTFSVLPTSCLNLFVFICVPQSFISCVVGWVGVFVTLGQCSVTVIQFCNNVLQQCFCNAPVTPGLRPGYDLPSSSSSFGFSHQGSPQRIFFLQFLLSTVSSSVTSTSAMSSFTTSINLLFGLPRFLFPGNSILSILLPIYPSSFLRRCPYHLSLASRVFSPNFPTCAVPLMYSFLILSILVTPNENRNIFNSATSISASCLFVSATVSNPYNIAGLTATLYTFPFTLAGTLLSQITPDILLHPFHPACTLFFTSLPHSPLLCTVEPRYLKSSTFATSSPCIFTVPLLLSCLSFTHMYSVFLLLTFIPLLSKAYLQLSSFSSTCRLRPTCDRKMLESCPNRRKNVRLVAEVVDDCKGQIRRSKVVVMFKPQSHRVYDQVTTYLR